MDEKAKLIGSVFLTGIIVIGLIIYIPTIQLSKPIDYDELNGDVSDVSETSALIPFSWYNSLLDTTSISWYEQKEFNFIVNNTQCRYSDQAPIVMIANYYSFCFFELNNGDNVNMTGLYINNIFKVHTIKVI